MAHGGGVLRVSLLARQDKTVVRRFVKPVHDVDRSAGGAVVAMAGHDVHEVGRARLPVLTAATGYIVCTVTNQRTPR